MRSCRRRGGEVVHDQQKIEPFERLLQPWAVRVKVEKILLHQEQGLDLSGFHRFDNRRLLLHGREQTGAETIGSGQEIKESRPFEASPEQMGEGCHEGRRVLRDDICSANKNRPFALSESFGGLIQPDFQIRIRRVVSEKCVEKPGRFPGETVRQPPVEGGADDPSCTEIKDLRSDGDV